jgi:hypothetical protein
MYLYVTISFLGLLFLAFYTMKISKIRATNNIANSYTQIVNNDEANLQIISYLIFAFFLITSPLVLFGYRRLNFAVRLCNALKGFFRRMVTMHFFELLLQIFMYGLMGFQVFVMCNLLTYGTTTNTTSTSPFNMYSLDIVGIPIYVFEIVGSYWAFSFLACYCQFIVSCNMYIWYY